jgi:DNA polymerase elongation subunit (family B)
MLASSYKTKPVHVQLAERLKLRKEQVQVGDRINYIYIENTETFENKNKYEYFDNGDDTSNITSVIFSFINPINKTENLDKLLKIDLNEFKTKNKFNLLLYVLIFIIVIIVTVIGYIKFIKK